MNENRNYENIYDERIMERCLGDLEGKPYTSNNNIWDININSSSDSMETMVEFKNRIYDFLDEVLNEYQNKNILLVTHGGVSALINCYFNNNLYEGSISDKFLKNCDYACYDTAKNKVLVRN
ncbi:MAG: histidine phosphatase family protein [Bacilli bacterium]|nr:histidine phosphatase family protein [Bacilli bacterium]